MPSAKWWPNWRLRECGSVWGVHSSHHAQFQWSATTARSRAQRARSSTLPPMNLTSLRRSVVSPVKQGGWPGKTVLRTFELTVALYAWEHDRGSRLRRQPTLRSGPSPAPAPFASPAPACRAGSRAGGGWRGVQSIVTFFRTVSTRSRAIARSVSSPRTRTALSLVSERIVEGEFVLGEAELLASRISRASLISASMTCAASIARFW